MPDIRNKIESVKKALDELEIISDPRVPPFGESTKEDLLDLKHKAIIFHAEIEDGMTFTILRYFYPKGIILRDKPLSVPQMGRAIFLNKNFIVKLNFARKLEIFRDLKEYYGFDSELFPLIRRVNDIRNDFAHPSRDNMSKYLSLRQLCKAYEDLLEGVNSFKKVIEQVKEKSQLLDEK